MEQIPKVQKLVDNLSAEIDNLEDELMPFIDKHISEQKFNNNVDRAQYYTFLAYALDSLIFAYLKSQGENTNTHPIMKELERVKGYMAKIKERQDPSGEQEKERTTTVDKEAAHRIITSALDDSQKTRSSKRKSKK